MEERWLAVRCCCTPTKILGFLKLPASVCKPGEVPVAVARRVELRSFSIDDSVKPYETVVAYERVHLRHYGYPSELAVYSEEKPAEHWRKFEGMFVEVR